MKYHGVELVWYNKNWYHPNFFVRGPACIKRAKYTCQHCKAPRGGWCITTKGNLDKVVIQACHVYHDPWNPRAKLIALCKQCHLIYDAPMHGEKAGQTRRISAYEEMKKGIENNGQQRLSLKFRKERKRLDTRIPKLMDQEWVIQHSSSRPKKNKTIPSGLEQASLFAKAE